MDSAYDSGTSDGHPSRQTRSDRIVDLHSINGLPDEPVVGPGTKVGDILVPVWLALLLALFETLTNFLPAAV